MVTTIQQPADLVRFISNVPVMSDGTIPQNIIDGVATFHSNMFTPVYALSILSRETASILTDGTVEAVQTSLDPSTIVYMALNCDLSIVMPSVYTLLRATVLEAFSFLYSIDYAPQNLKYVTAQDFVNIKNNIKYIADYFSSDSRYYKLISPMRDMTIAFGYVENQTQVIMNDKGV
jgi:hypothetical protein